MFQHQDARQRHGYNHGNSPVPKRTLGSGRSRMDSHLTSQSPRPTHMSSHPPVTPYQPYRNTFGSISPSPFTSPFQRLTTPFRKYSRRFTPQAGSYGGMPTTASSEDQLDLQAALVVYVCLLVIAVFLYWFSSTLHNGLVSMLAYIVSLVVFFGALYGLVSDIYVWVIIPYLREVQSSISSFSFASYFPFLLAPSAPVGVINTPPRTMHGGRISRASPTKIAGMDASRMSTHAPIDNMRGTRKHDAYHRPTTNEFLSPNRGRNDVIFKDGYGRTIQETESAGSSTAASSTSKGLLGGVTSYLFGNGPSQRSGGVGAPSGVGGGGFHVASGRDAMGGRSTELPLTGGGGRGRGSLPERQGTPVGAAFAANFSPIPAKAAPNASPWMNGIGTGASKLFSPMSLDSARMNTSMTSNFSFMGVGGDDGQMELQPAHQRYATSAPLSPRRNQKQFGVSNYSRSNGTSFYGDQAAHSRVLQPTTRGQNQFSRFDGGGLHQRYGGSYRHHKEEKKRPSLAAHVDSWVELYRALRIVDKMHNWADQMRWWLLQKVIASQTEAWDVNDVNVNELFQFICDKFPENSAQLSTFQTVVKRGEFFLANIPQITEMSRHFKAPQIIEIVQKRQHIVNAMKKISGSSRHLDYLHDRLKHLSNCTNPADIRWNGGGLGWESGVLPTDSQLMMSVFGQFMDDYLCPAVEFTGKFLIKCDLFPQDDGMDEMVRKHCQGGFSDVAIVEVGHHTFDSKQHDKVMGPYYFVIFDKTKYREADERGRSRVNDGRQHRSTNHKSSHSSSSSKKYTAWYPQPGASNMIQALTLFAFFVHEYMGDEIAGKSLRDQQMFVECLRT